MYVLVPPASELHIHTISNPKQQKQRENKKSKITDRKAEREGERQREGENKGNIVFSVLGDRACIQCLWNDTLQSLQTQKHTCQEPH